MNGASDLGDQNLDQAEETLADPETERSSRRRLLRMGAIGVAAVGAAAVGNAVWSTPAGADTGDPLVIGELNDSTSEDLTELFGGPISIYNQSHSVHLPAVLANNSAGPGVQGLSDGPYIGVEGTAQGETAGAIGVKGTGVIGIQGVTNGTTVDIGPGVLGVGNATGAGVQAQNASGASLLLSPYGSATLPARSETGQFIVLSDGSLHYSYADDSWVPVKSTVQITPVRVIDTVTGVGGITGPLVPGATVYTSSIIAGTNGIPGSATGLVGNFAISGVNGALLNGYGVATIFPAGAATPATASINAGYGCFAISNGVSVGFGTGGNAGKVSIVWNGGGPVPHAHAYLDVSGYIL